MAYFGKINPHKTFQNEILNEKSSFNWIEMNIWAFNISMHRECFADMLKIPLHGIIGTQTHTYSRAQDVKICLLSNVSGRDLTFLNRNLVSFLFSLHFPQITGVMKFKMGIIEAIPTKICIFRLEHRPLFKFISNFAWEHIFLASTKSIGRLELSRIGQTATHWNDFKIENECIVLIIR